MIELSSDIISLFEKQGFVIVSTLDAKGNIHCVAKGIVSIKKEGKVFLVDIYQASTFNNLKRNPTVTITAIDEHQFSGYALKGKGYLIGRDGIKAHVLKKWEEMVTKRVSNRLIKNLKEDKKTSHHPESLFPQPKNLIEIDVEEIIDLTPRHLKREI